jgi:acyl phosphate:glycerol-3-phosphate acyltransferase
MQAALCIGILVGAYLLGGIPFGLLVARAYGMPDIRRHGSGNIGATNVWRVVGRKAAIWVYLLDIGKGVAAVLLAKMIEQTLLPQDTFLVLVAAAAVCGHVFSPYLGFRGGKGVNTGLGVMLVLLPLELLIGFVVFMVVVAISRYISLGSIAGAATLPAVILLERELLGKTVAPIYLYLAILLAILVVYTHRKNIGRLVTGTESRFSLSSKGGKPEVKSHG